MDHRCRERDRIEELRGAIGQAAYAHYSEWMKAKKRSVPPIETFSTSKLYGTFLKFAEYAQKTNIPDVRQFIRLMVQQNDVSPVLWCRPNVYSMYIEWYDQANKPEVQVLESLDMMKALVVEYGTTNAEVFGTIGVDDLALLVKKRKLSPWFMLSSKTFRTYLSGLDQLQKEKLENALNINAMIQRIQKDSEMFQFFNQVIAAEGF